MASTSRQPGTNMEPIRSPRGEKHAQYEQWVGGQRDTKRRACPAGAAEGSFVYHGVCVRCGGSHGTDDGPLA